MGVRCTLFGHTYGDSEIERDREERGDEAVVTIRELQVCERCGTETVVSENKEVTSVAGPAPAPVDEPEPATVSEDDVPEVDDERVRDPETDDGVILQDAEDDAEPEERQYGEWPDAEEPADAEAADAEGADGQSTAGDAATADEPPEWPEAEGRDEGFDASTPGDDQAADAPGLAETERPADDDASDAATGDVGDVLASGAADVADAASSSGDTSGDADDAAVEGADEIEFFGSEEAEPDRTGAGHSDAQRSAADGTGSSLDSGGGSGMQREGAAPRPSEAGPERTTLHCPACGYRDDSTDGSLRQGDVCPECKGGYLSARD